MDKNVLLEDVQLFVEMLNYTGLFLTFGQTEQFIAKIVVCKVNHSK